MRAVEAGRPLRDALVEDQDVTAHLPAEALDELFDYRRHAGLCRELVDRVVALAAEARVKDQAV